MKCDPKIQMHSSVTIGSKGQIVIPKDVRDALGLNPGDTLMTITKDSKYVGFIRSDDIPTLLEQLKSY